MDAQLAALRKSNEQRQIQALTFQELERNVRAQHRALIEFLTKSIAELWARTNQPEHMGADAFVLARLQEDLERQLERQLEY